MFVLLLVCATDRIYAIASRNDPIAAFFSVPIALPVSLLHLTVVVHSCTASICYLHVLSHVLLAPTIAFPLALGGLLF